MVNYLMGGAWSFLKREGEATWSFLKREGKGVGDKTCTEDIGVRPEYQDDKEPYWQQSFPHWRYSFKCSGLTRLRPLAMPDLIAVHTFNITFTKVICE